MKKKKCSSCEKRKKKCKFSKKNTICNKCNRLKALTHSRTKYGLVCRIYRSQKSSSKTRGHNLPTYTKGELQAWLYAQKKFHKLYDNWKRLDFQSKFKPSVDRKKDELGYTIANIQLMTWGENLAKANKVTHFYTSKGVSQFNLQGDLTATYKSVTEASNISDVIQGSISNCCNGKRKTAGGFKWGFTQK